MNERYIPSMTPRPLAEYFDALTATVAPLRDKWVFISGAYIAGVWHSLYGIPSQEVEQAANAWMVGGRMSALQPRKQLGGAHKGAYMLFATDSAYIGNKAVGVATDWSETYIASLIANEVKA
jgi:hypothetical protein